jgi:hypothetical protein
VRNGVIALLCVIVVAAVGLALPVTRDELRWWTATRGGRASNYGDYLKAWPDGRHAAEATAAYDERSWADAKAAGTVGSFELYLRDHPAGTHRQEAALGAETLRWINARRAGTVTAYRQYLTAFPSGHYVRDVNARVQTLIEDDAPYLAAMKQATKPAFDKFLADFPGHKREEDVRAAIHDMSGRDLVDLLDEKKVEVKAQGSGIESVHLEVKRLVNYVLSVRIPVGTFFVSRDPSAQNMVATAEATATLTSDVWTTVSVSAACANRPRDVPGDDDTFTVRRSPQQQELQRLMPALVKAGADSKVEQAAVWIVTDDADYDDLGILVSRSIAQVFGGTRVINEEEAALAMKICDEAGIDIRRKAIWGDVSEILDGLEDEDLKAWLKQRGKP